MKKDKIRDILLESGDALKEMLVGDDGNMNYDTRKKIEDSFKDDFGDKIASDVAFNLCDWVYDAAVILALNLAPEKFSKKEVNELIRDFLAHVPNHVTTAQFLQYKAMGLNKREVCKMIDPIINDVIDN